jgi:threonine 3-dehydrogenase
VSGRVDFSPIVTHRLPFDQFAQGFELMQSGQCGKVTLVL